MDLLEQPGDLHRAAA